MGAFAAQLLVAGHTFRVQHCTSGVEQATDQRGRVYAKVRYSPVQVLPDVPGSDVLTAWTADPHKRQATAIVFLDASSGSAIETLHLPAAYCIGYVEEFRQGDRYDGAYRCQLTLADPDGWTIQPGGPAAAFVDPAPSSPVLPLQAFEQEAETGENTSQSLDKDSLSPSAKLLLPVALEKMIGTTFHIEDLEPFVARVKSDLHLIYSTPSGRVLLDSLHASGKQVAIEYAMGGNEIGDYQDPAARFFQDDGTPGAGTGCCVGYNPTLERIGKEAWATRPPAIALAHELVHAEQAAYGRMRRGRAANGLTPALSGNTKAAQADVRELEAVGIPPHDTYPISENKIRAEWHPPQPPREYY